MTTTNHSTVPESPATEEATSHGQPIPGLVVIWCAARPDLAGAWLPVGPGQWIFGRGPALPNDAHPRLQLLRQRPGVNLTLSALENASVSRVQLILSGRADCADVFFSNVGKCAVHVNGDPAQERALRPGDVIEVGSQISFLCTERPVRLAGEPTQHHAFGDPDAYGLVGESVAMWQLRTSLAFIGPRSGHVLVQGETGTGKELIARALHTLSQRPGAFVARNAATLPEALIDAELFGNAPNYPNPGMRERVGLVGAADRGTLFLDEIAELPVGMQTHMLRVLDAGEYQRLGESAARRADLRVIGATNRPASSLREDVRARFAFLVEVPSLRSRPDDVPLILQVLFRQMSADDPELKARLSGADGEPELPARLVRELVQSPPASNVRGLRKALWSALAGSEPARADPTNGRATSPSADARPHDAMVARIVTALDEHAGSLEAAWRALGLSSRFALMRLMKKHGISVRKNAAQRDE